MKILIVKVSALGDVVHALPVLTYLKSVDPALEIDWLVERPFLPLLEGHPLLRRVLALDTKGWRNQGGLTPLREALSLVRQLRREGYDLVLDLQGNCKSGLFTRLSGAPLRYGFDLDGAREWPNLLATNRRVVLTSEDHHVSDRSLAIARTALPGGDQTLTAGTLPVSAAALARVEKHLQELGLTAVPLVVLHYGTTWSTKLWPLDCWMALAKNLVEQGIRPLLSWGNETERLASQAIADACAGQALLWPRGSLPELVALLSRADLVIGADTGPVHMAAAVETPTVSIYRVTDARRNGPRGERHICLQSPLDCSPCLRKTCDQDDMCGRSISVDSVIAASRKLLGETGA
ncbi:MAG: lipopolysaccharide heptosyltransferase I [Desulfuromonadaceae bacterium]